jgi:plasmid maintenance system killer protein
VTTIEPTGHILGATVRGIDLAEPLSDSDFAAILKALGAHGVLHFPDQKLEARALRDFSRRFGRIQATLTGRHHEPGMPEVGILSNIIENGEPIGITDAGQRKLAILDAAESLRDLRVPPGNRLEKLSGDREGQHSIRVNDQWRICFRWRDGDALDVEITDYH